MEGNGEGERSTQRRGQKEAEPHSPRFEQEEREPDPLEVLGWVSAFQFLRR